MGTQERKTRPTLESWGPILAPLPSLLLASYETLCVLLLSLHFLICKMGLVVTATHKETERI